MSVSRFNYSLIADGIRDVLPYIFAQLPLDESNHYSRVCRDWRDATQLVYKIYVETIDPALYQINILQESTSIPVNWKAIARIVDLDAQIGQSAQQNKILLRTIRQKISTNSRASTTLTNDIAAAESACRQKEREFEKQRAIRIPLSIALSVLNVSLVAATFSPLTGGHVNRSPIVIQT